MAISFVGSSFGTTTAALPAHQAGDLILVFAYNQDATTVPSAISGYTNVPNNAAGGNSNAHRASYKIAASSNESIGTLTNTTQVVVHVYRGVDQTTPVGAGAALTNIQDVNYPALTLQVTDGTSWVAAIHGRRTGNVESAAVPPGTVMRSDTGTSGGGRILGYDSNRGVTDWPQLATGGNNTFRYRSMSAEIRAAPDANPANKGTLARTLGSLTAASTAKVQIRGATARTLGSLALSAASRLSVRATLARTLGPMTTVSAARADLRAQGSGALGPLTSVATARLAARGALARTLGPMTVAARSAGQGSGAVAVVLGALTALAEGQSARRAQAVLPLGPMTTVSSATKITGGRVSGQLAPTTLSSAARLAVRGSASAELGPLVASAQGRVRAAGSLSVLLGALTAGATGAFGLVAEVAVVLGEMLASVRGRFLAPAEVAPDRVLRVAAEDRSAAVAPEDRVLVLSPGEHPMTALLSWPAKDPDEVLDYQLDWSARLAGDTISDVEWLVPADLEVTREASTPTSTTIWLAGGTLQTSPVVLCRVTTAAGRVMDQSARLPIRAR